MNAKQRTHLKAEDGTLLEVKEGIILNLDPKKRQEDPPRMQTRIYQWNQSSLAGTFLAPIFSLLVPVLLLLALATLGGAAALLVMLGAGIWLLRSIFRSLRR